jgi:hypothetical protein
VQGDKAEWHIASGVVYKSKKLAPDEMAAMVDRLCVAKHKVRSSCYAGRQQQRSLLVGVVHVTAAQQPSVLAKLPVHAHGRQLASKRAQAVVAK